MNETAEQRCNLVFAGQLLPGTDGDAARRTLAGFFGLKDLKAVEGFFSGRPVPLRRSIPRRDALRIYRDLRSVGLICDIVEVADAPDKKSKQQASRPAAESRTPAPERTAPRSEQPTSRPAPTPTPSPSPTPAPAPAPAPRPAERRPRAIAPNLFALRPTASARHDPRERERTQVRFMITLATAMTLAVVVGAVLLRFPAAPVGERPAGPHAAAVLPDNGLVLLFPGALLIHERSGLPRRRIDAETLGLPMLAPPLWISSEGVLFLNSVGDDGGRRLQRCELQTPACTPFLEGDAQISAITASYLGDRLFMHSDRGQLLLIDGNGKRLASADVPPAYGQPRLQYSDGLLLVPSDSGPLLNVYRPDTSQFGAQLDALILMPDGAITGGQDRIQDIALGTDFRWALMRPEDGPSSLYRFDRQWGDGAQISLGATLTQPYLVNWRDKILVASRAGPRIKRFAADGTVEADFDSEMIVNLAEEWSAQTRNRALLRQAGVALPLTIAVVCLLLALLYFAQGRSMDRLPGQSTALLDPMPAGIRWIGSHRHRDRQINRLGLLLMVSATLPVIALWLAGRELQSGVFLAAVIGSAFSWSALRQGAGGYIGTVGQRAITVDHDGQYFYGERTHLRRSGNWLVAPGVTLPLRMGPIVNIDPEDSGAASAVAASPCEPMDLLGMLWRRGHPWMRSGLYLALGWAVSLLGLALTSA